MTNTRIHNVIFDRDAGLSIKAWLDVNDNNHDAVAEVLNAYVGWVQKVQKDNNQCIFYSH